MDTPTLPDTTEPNEWLAWMADHPCLGEAIEAAIEARVHYRLLAYAVGKWEAENRADELAERIMHITERALASVR